MQNFKTFTVHLNQVQYERIQEFPIYQPPRTHGFAGRKGYRVVDVVLKDGTRHEGLLVVSDDYLLVPEFVSKFDDRDIAELHATPRERHPDFTITDPDGLRTERGIELGNMIRLSMFGPEPMERNWREAPIDEVFERALEENSYIHSYDGEIPACYHGPNLVALVPGGMKLSLHTASTDEGVEMVIRPKTAAVWRAVLDLEFKIDPNFTLGELAKLLDLPDDVSREVFLRTMPNWRGPMTFRPWVTAILRQEAEPDENMDWIEISAEADIDENNIYTFYYDAVLIGKPLKEDDSKMLIRAGERIRWSLWGYPDLARLRDLPIRYKVDMALPVPTEEMMRYYRGPHREWVHNGRQGEEPPLPVAFRCKRSIKLADFIGALFSELSLEAPFYEWYGK